MQSGAPSAVTVSRDPRHTHPLSGFVTASGHDRGVAPQTFSETRRRRRRAARPGRLTTRLGAVLLALVLVLAAAGCSGDDDPSPAPEDGASSGKEARERSLPRGLTRSTIEVGQVAGRLSRPDRRRLESEVGGLVDRWFRRAWLSAPLGKEVDPFPGFTPAAERRARSDRQVTTVRSVEPPLGGVVPRTRGIRLDVLSPGGTPQAVTARVHLGMAAYDKRLERLEGRVVVSGRLMLAKVGRRWMVFGYDLATSTPGETGTAGAQRKAQRKAQKKAQRKARKKAQKRGQQKAGKKARTKDGKRDRKEARR